MLYHNNIFIPTSVFPLCLYIPTGSCLKFSHVESDPRDTVWGTKISLCDCMDGCGNLIMEDLKRELAHITECSGCSSPATSWLTGLDGLTQQCSLIRTHYRTKQEVRMETQ